MSTFLETVQREFNRMQASRFATADGYEGVTHAGLCIVAEDTGFVLLAQRAFDATDDPEVRETWEFPGGSLDPGEHPFIGVAREFEEEMGLPLPGGDVVNGWRSPNGIYQGFVYVIPTAFDRNDWAPTGEVQAYSWVPPLPAYINRDMQLRPEMSDFDWKLAVVSGNEEDPMSQMAPDPDEITEDPAEEATETPDQEAAEEIEEPDYSEFPVLPDHLMVHGVLAPEAVPSGDSRGFTAGAVTSRPLRLPVGWQEVTASGHDNATTVSSIDRMMRKDGLIHFEGQLMMTPKADEFTELLAFFGQYGISMDGVNGNIDMEKSAADGMVWFDAVRVAGAVACSVPAFGEAYIALGAHPTMPADDSADALTASGIEATDMIGTRMSFARGPGWVTDPKATNRIHDYWTKKGQPGYEKVGWGKPGDFARAKALIGEKIAKHSPDKMRFLNQIIAQWHFDALGYWPATHAKMVRGGDVKAASAEKVGSLEVSEALFDEADEEGRIEPVGLRDDGAILYDLAPTDGIEADAEGTGWEAVLVSSAGVRAMPPFSYFEQHPDTDALVIEEPDEFGLRRTYGWAAELGVCHIGKTGRCVEVPLDLTGEYREFHLGRTKTADEGYISTGVITYKVDHRDAQTILSESAEQQHFDNIAHAWAAVRVGNDPERGIWFSGVVLPTVPEEDIVLIEAAGQVSGEWLRGSMRALQAVNVPGFPVMRASAVEDEEGNVLALVASAHGLSECEPTPAERMAVLAKIDAEVRFEALKQAWS